MENSGFRMRGYSYPGQSPLKQKKKEDIQRVMLKEVKIVSRRDRPITKFIKKLPDRLKMAGKYVTKTFNESIRDNEFLRGLATKAAVSMLDKKKKKFTPVNITGKQKKIM